MAHVRRAVLLWPLHALLLRATPVFMKLALLVTILAVRRVPPLPTPPLSNAPLLRTKKLPPVMPDILGLLAMPLAKRAMPVPLQIREQMPGQPRVLLVPLVRTH